MKTLLTKQKTKINGNNTTVSILMILHDQILNMLTTAEDLSNESSPGLLAAHAANLDSMWTEFRNTVYQEKASGAEISFDLPTLRRRYINISGRINDLIKPKYETTQNCEQASNDQFNLPEIQLPEFNGKPNEWKRFIALYDRMVHNNSKIDNGIKIEYLKTCVKGQAAKIINHMDPNPDNYLTCYELLRKRFDNKREMLEALIDNIMKIPKMESENAELLKAMHDTVFEAIMSIKNIDISTDNWDPLLCHILTRKLDAATLVSYECQLHDVRKPQTLPDFLAYLEKRFMALHSATAGESHL